MSERWTWKIIDVGDGPVGYVRLGSRDVFIASADSAKYLQGALTIECNRLNAELYRAEAPKVDAPEGFVFSDTPAIDAACRRIPRFLCWCSEHGFDSRQVDDLPETWHWLALAKTKTKTEPKGAWYDQRNALERKVDSLALERDEALARVKELEASFAAAVRAFTKTTADFGAALLEARRAGE